MPSSPRDDPLQSDSLPWNPLRPGSAIAVVAPAGRVDPETYTAGLAILETRYDIVYAFDPTQKPPSSTPYLARDDNARASELSRVLNDQRIDAVFAARGGYGCLRLLPLLDVKALKARSLPIVGFSDITALHAWAYRAGVVSIHAPVVSHLSALNAAELAAFFDGLEGMPLLLDGLETISAGKSAGRLFGGNLTVLCHLVGTPFMPDLRGTILFLEDIGEAPYRIDRMLTQMILAGVFTGVAGIVLGDFLRLSAVKSKQTRITIDPAPPTFSDPAVHRVLEERLGGLRIPMVSGAPIGHDMGRNRLLALGQTVRLDASGGRLTGK